MAVDDRNERTKALDVALSQIEKQFGKGSIMRLGQKGAIAPVDVDLRPAPSVSTLRSASAACPAAASSRSSGRSRRARRRWRCSSSPRRRSWAAWRPSSTPSTRSTPTYAQKLGVDLDNLLVSQPDNGEQALEIVEVLVRSGGVDVVVVDSVAALVPRAEIEGEMGDAQMGLQARLMSQALRKLTGVVVEVEDVAGLHQPAAREDRRDVRQPRDDHRRARPEVLRLGPPRHPAHRQHQGRRHGGRRPHARQGRQEQGGAALPRGRVRHPVRRGHLASEGDLLDLAVDRKIVEKSGTWFSFGGERLGQGRENAKQFLKDNPAIFKTMEEQVRKELGLTREAAVDPDAPTEKEKAAPARR